MYALNIPIHCNLAIKNLRTEPLLFLFSKKINLYVHIHNISLPYFYSIHVISVEYFCVCLFDLILYVP